MESQAKLTKTLADVLLEVRASGGLLTVRRRDWRGDEHSPCRAALGPLWMDEIGRAHV